MRNNLSRRDFLKLAGISSAGLALSACGVESPKLPDLTVTPSITPSVTPLPTSTSTPTLTPTPEPPTIADLARKIGMDIGIEANYLGLFSPNKTAIKFSEAPKDYVKSLLNFSILTNGYEGDPQWTDHKPDIAFGFWHDFSLFCQPGAWGFTSRRHGESQLR